MASDAYPSPLSDPRRKLHNLNLSPEDGVVSAAFQLATHQLLHIQTLVADPEHDLLRMIIGTPRLQRLQLTCLVYSLTCTTTMVLLWYYSELPNVIYTWELTMAVPYVAFVLLVVLKHWLRHPLCLGSIPLLFRSMASFYLTLSLITSATLLLLACSGTPRPPIMECVALMVSLFNLLFGSLRWEFHKYARCCEWVLQRDYGIERVMLSDVIVINHSILHQLEECSALVPDIPTIPTPQSTTQRLCAALRWLVRGWDFIRPEIIDVTHRLRATRRGALAPEMERRRRSIYKEYRSQLLAKSTKQLLA